MADFSATEIEPAADDAPDVRVSNRFPWPGLIAVWLVLSALLMIRFWPEVTALHFSDADDLMRLMQVRDLLHGQSWFDMTQHRLDPPTGLAMHWSRLVDLPLLIVIAPLAPLIGEAHAEMVAVSVVPLLTLGATMAATLLAVRRLIGPDPLLVLLSPFMVLAAPAVLIQMFPTRIDHHGWQICMGTIAFAALLDERAKRSGILAGLASAILLSISIEGLPYVVGVAGILALLWALGRESPERLRWFMAMLAAVSVICFVTTAPTLRWTTPLCDVVKPGHVATFVTAAVGIAITTLTTASRGVASRLIGIALTAAAAAAVFGVAAPDCFGSPFGAMDPLVRTFWYDSVLEGMPFYDQSFLGVVSMLAFPIVGMAGAGIALRMASSPASRRRWLLALLIGFASFLVGAAVRRAAGQSHVIAVPGALMLIQLLRPRIEAVRMLILRVSALALMIFGLSPLMPVSVVGAFVPDPGATPIAPETGCGPECGLAAIGRLPPSTMFTEIDVAPRLLFATHHSAYAGGYHRLEGPIHDTVAAFIGTSATARDTICGGRFGYVLTAPESSETQLYTKAAPSGFLAQLVNGQPPPWLQPIPLPTRALALYRVIRSPACRTRTTEGNRPAE